MALLEWGGEPVNPVGIDLHFARFVAGFGGNYDHIFLGAALASMVARNGHSCLELREWSGGAVRISEKEVAIPPLSEWYESLAASPAVGDGSGCRPLVLTQDRLYLSRYWGYEEGVAAWFESRGRESLQLCDEERLAAGLLRWFPESFAGDGGEQGLAALICLLRPVAIITGGPGTGKTTTVAKILALLAEQFQGQQVLLRVALAAPTGKSAMRLQESIAKIKGSGIFPQEIAKIIPDQVVTVHRLLGPISGRPDFRHDEHNPLPAEVVVVDEVSMVDLPLMAKLLRALSRRTRLILLGDRYQLSSVEPGSVLGDLCRPEQVAHFSGEMTATLRRFGENLESAGGSGSLVGLADSLVELSRSHRFGAASGIGRLGAAVREGEFDRVWQILAEERTADVVWREVNSPGHLEELLGELVAEGVFAGLAGSEPSSALACGNALQILCALRRGPCGADQVNAILEQIFAGGKAPGEGGRDYPGRPVMVLRNDYDLGLYNGDVGVLLAAGESEGGLRAFFPEAGEGFRQVAPARLPPHQTSYAMTVHKSQGSEFDRVIVILPDRPSPVLSRELLFTAITRAKKLVEVWGNRQVLELAVATGSERRSGLGDKLWGETAGSLRR